MKIACTGFVTAFAACVALAPALAASAADVMPLAAHRAVYDLKLVTSTGNKAPASARGRIAFDFSGSACDGYITNFRQITEMVPAEGPVRLADLSSATFEDGNGKAFTFKMQTRLDDAKNEDIDGRAARSTSGDLSIDLKQPLVKKADLGQNAIFPTDHIKHILAAALAGQTTLGVKVFDGSDGGEKIYDTLTVIGKPLTNTPAEGAAQLPELKGMRRWPVTISYFTFGKGADTPDYVLSFDLFENGISSALKLDYGEFVLAGVMNKLEMLPMTACAK